MTECCDNPKRFKIALSAGLIAAIIAHAVIFAGVERALPKVEQYLLDTPQTATPAAPPGGLNFDSARYGSPNTLPVNNAARDEIKKQILGRRITPYSTPYRSPNCPDGNCPPGTQPNVQPVPNSVPANNTQTSNMQPVKTQERYSIELFVTNDQQSQAMQQWFKTHPTLQKWTTTCNHNTYTADNPLYRSRYAPLIPPDSFPVCLVTAPNGGHVYAADRYALPTTAAALVTAISDATKLHQSIMAGSTSPLPAQPQPPVNGQAAQHPAPDYIEQCADGSCPPDARFPLLDRLRDRPKDTVEGLLTAIFSPTEFLMQILIIAVGTFIIIYLIKTR
jgi:hypothetical protein